MPTCKNQNALPTGKPTWLKKKLPAGGDYQRVRQLLARSKLHTVCQEANCPNMFECFSKDTATFMILGTQCSRNCRFCNVTPGPPEAKDPEEPMRVAQAARDLGLRYVVVTSVTRDDLPDGGAGQFAATIAAIKQTLPVKDGIPARVEVLIPDFLGDTDAIKTVVDAAPHVLNHNVETVPALYPRVRPEAIYQRSLDVIANVKNLNPAMLTKSGIMVGLGETLEALEQTMTDLRAHGCDILTIGQYLQPTRDHLPVHSYYSPEQFEALEKTALKMGFCRAACGPHVRSSYKAQDLFESSS